MKKKKKKHCTFIWMSQSLAHVRVAAVLSQPHENGQDISVVRHHCSLCHVSTHTHTHKIIQTSTNVNSIISTGVSTTWSRDSNGTFQPSSAQTCGWRLFLHSVPVRTPLSPAGSAPPAPQIRTSREVTRDGARSPYCSWCVWGWCTSPESGGFCKHF